MRKKEKVDARVRNKPSFFEVRRTRTIASNPTHRLRMQEWQDDGQVAWRIGWPDKLLCIPVQFGRREDAERAAVALEKTGVTWDAAVSEVREQTEQRGGVPFLKQVIAEAMAW